MSRVTLREERFLQVDSDRNYGQLWDNNNSFRIINNELNAVRQGRANEFRDKTPENDRYPKKVLVSLMLKWYAIYFQNNDEGVDIGGLFANFLKSLDDARDAQAQQQVAQDDQDDDMGVGGDEREEKDLAGEQDEKEVADGMEDADINGVRPDRAVRMDDDDDDDDDDDQPDPPPGGGPNNPDENGTPHFTKYLYNTEDDVPNRPVNLNADEVAVENDKYRSLAGELLAYARWGNQQRRDVGDLVVRGNNALLAKAVISPNEYDARNARIRKRDTFGAPDDLKPHARDTYLEYKDKDPRIVGKNIGRKIKNYVAQASRIWPTATNPNRPWDYVRI
jgi:hypothetical protein